MFSSTTATSDHIHQYSNSILECPPMRPMMMDTTTSARKWNFTTKVETAPNCPRCASSNTKFCYYNNYSLSQPRYFCKACRRYWTKGGSLRNVPVGGGCRKSRRSRSSSSSSSARHAGGSAGGPAVVSSSESEGSTCIDLAAVFANYVNQNVGSDESFSPGGSSGSSEDNNNNNNNALQAAVTSCLDLVNGGDDQVRQAAPEFSVHQQMDGQDFVYQDCGDAFDQLQQSILGDDDHMLWSDAGTDSIPISFGSENPTAEVQLQDFGLFSPDDQFRISANLATDNWSSFDLSTYEIFSTP